MSQHTLKKEKCGCFIEELKWHSEPSSPPVEFEYRIVYCPLHAAAPEMLRLIHAILDAGRPPTYDSPWVHEARALLKELNP